MTKNKTTFRIEDIHPSLNDWAVKWHHYHRAKVKKQWEELVYYSCRGCKPIHGPVKVKVDYYFPTKRRRDLDNYAPKFILDGMVKAGLIEEDNSNTLKELTVTINYEKNVSYTDITVSSM